MLLLVGVGTGIQKHVEVSFNWEHLVWSMVFRHYGPSGLSLSLPDTYTRPDQQEQLGLPTQTTDRKYRSDLNDLSTDKKRQNGVGIYW
eukprot:CAMPEP_0117077308 /NCGR_PEP_ID=MMETSP0472-20121206/54504_1 /TAXON_ID=693140 ORGANISM="Tiarina fusus, Strain LIS" /NCGR_SAMPLE_ID=MMETSP0472 /ASSEMBLY_ACC=CAM_ASM_000603 /LENGTH=87 /DNA_ID=CAMNT_0004803579 /DNA_START=187 /DNA_END=447 /DNA_ORIENTATION=-